MWCSVLLLLIMLTWSWMTVPGQVSATAMDRNGMGVPDTSPSAVSASDSYDFSKLSLLIKRLDVLEAAGPDALLGFYDSTQQSFSIRPQGNRQRVCITSTCYALLTLTAVPSSNVYESILPSWSEKDETNLASTETGSAVEESGVPTKIPIRNVLRRLLSAQWREDDAFQVPLLMYTILKIDSDRSLIRSMIGLKDTPTQPVSDNSTQTPLPPDDDEDDDHNSIVADRLRQLIEIILRSRPQRRAGMQQPFSDYIFYQVCKVLALLFEGSIPSTSVGNQQGDLKEIQAPTVGGLPPSVVPKDASFGVYWGLVRCAEVGKDELCRQLAYRTAGDSNSFDVIRLVYSLLTYYHSTVCLSGIAGKELVPGEGPAPETKVAPLNHKLVKAALHAFFAEQNNDGLWDKGQPIYMSLGSRSECQDMENGFVFAVNTVGSLLCMLPAEYFRPYLRELENTLVWIENHQTLEMITDYVDKESGQCYGRPLRGWSSPHWSPNSGPQAWPTAQVLKCVSWMKTTIRQLMHNDVLEEFHGVSFSNDGIQPESWDSLLDTDIGDPTKEDCRTIKSVLEERVVNPFSASIDNPSYGAAYSAILFGPPGTAKSTICEALAKRMGYDFVVIDTASFLADGLTNVAARIRYVFTRLMALKKCIILFDEIEEFALDRESPTLSMESRMLTTAMLTAINDLRRTKRSIFFVATNRLRSFDSAITRPGRFDMQLFVGTPNLDSRVIQLAQQLEGRIDETRRQAALDAYRSFLQSVWTQDAMFMNYLEGIQFASACARIVLSDRPLTKSEMNKLLTQQAMVMTVRGSARDDYLASMELSRL